MDTATVAATVAERVARGAALLDQAYVNRDVAWWDQVDLDRLDLYSPAWCVLAQTVGRHEPGRPCWCGDGECIDTTPGSFGDGMDVLGLEYVQSTDHGFTVGPEGHQALRDAWHNVIENRRQAPRDTAE